MKRNVLTAAGVALVVLFVYSPAASAKWAFGQGPTDLDVNTLPAPAPPGQVCATHVDGRAGLSTEADPSVPPGPPPGPYPSFTVELYAGAPGSLDGAFYDTAKGQLVTTDGTPLTPVATVTTLPGTALDPAEPFDAPTDSGLEWEYAAASFSFTLAPGTISPGEDVLVHKVGYSAYVVDRAVACAAVPIHAAVDVSPGLRGHPVVPWLKLPILVVRVSGSASLDVTKIKSVKLGNAASVAVPPSLASLFGPKDRDGDGFLDRDYIFVPAQTGIQCGDTATTLSGTLDDGTAFSGTGTITTVACR